LIGAWKDSYFRGFLNQIVRVKVYGILSLIREDIRKRRKLLPGDFRFRNSNKIIFRNKNIGNIRLVLIIVYILEMEYLVYQDNIPDRRLVIENKDIFVKRSNFRGLEFRIV
jgi:hypothetical protein